MGKLGVKYRDHQVMTDPIVTHSSKWTFHETVETIRENPYLQYFLDLPEYRYEELFHHSLIASLLRLSKRAIELHRHHLMHKLGVDNTVELVKRAGRMALVELSAKQGRIKPR